MQAKKHTKTAKVLESLQEQYKELTAIEKTTTFYLDLHRLSVAKNKVSEAIEELQLLP
jgi:hypothetical protein